MIFSNTCDPLFHFTTIQQYFSNLVDSSFVEHEEEVWTVGSMHVQKKNNNGPKQNSRITRCRINITMIMIDVLNSSIYCTVHSTSLSKGQSDIQSIVKVPVHQARVLGFYSPDTGQP